MNIETVRTGVMAGATALVAGVGLAAVAWWTMSAAVPVIAPNATVELPGLTADRASTSDGTSATEGVPPAASSPEARVKAMMERLKAAAQQPMREVPEGQEGTRDLDVQLATLQDSGVQVRVLARQCTPLPCVTAMQLRFDEDRGDAVKDQVYMAAIEAAQHEDAQPAVTWTDVDGGAVGHLWFVPNDATAEDAQGLNDRAMGNMVALGG